MKIHQLCLLAISFSSLFCQALAAEEPENKPKNFSAPRIQFTTSDACAAISNPIGNQHSGNFYPVNEALTDLYDHGKDFPRAGENAARNLCLDEAKLELAAAEFGKMPVKVKTKDGKEKFQTPIPASLLVIRNGKIAFERYFHGADERTSNNVHSASKTILSLAVGLALKESPRHHLDQLLVQVLPEYAEAFQADPRKRKLTIHHLLSMEGGLEWSEDETEYEIEKQSDWVRSILSQKSNATPGKVFKYNTGLTHVLSAVLSKITGRSTCDYVNEKIFQPLSITAERWNRDPQGVFTGGFSLNITPREMGKVGQLLMNGGKWKNQSIGANDRWVKSWISQMSTSQAGGVASKSYPAYKFRYGFLGWIKENGPVVMVNGKPKKARYSCAWGWGGQFICNVWDLGMVVVMTTNTNDDNEFVDEKNGFEILDNYILAAVTDKDGCKIASAAPEKRKVASQKD